MRRKSNRNGRKRGLYLSFFLTAIMISAAVGAESGPPPTPQRPHFDTLYGNVIADPYRWLENEKDTAVQNWIDAQDKYARAFLAKYPKRGVLQKRIEKLMKVGSVDYPDIRGDRYFFMRRQFGEDHDVLYMKRGPAGIAQVILNPNKFSKDGTVALDWWSLSDDGRYIAYGKSSKGTENSTLFILDVDSLKNLADTIPFTSAADVAWLKDNSGFYYTRYPAPGTVPPGDEVYYRHIYFHRIGEDYRTDPKIFGEGRDKTEWTGVQLSSDNRYMLITASIGWAVSSLYLKDLTGDTAFISLTAEVPSLFAVTLDNDRFYIQTNFQAPRYKVMVGFYDRPQIQFWRDCIPEGEMTLEGMLPIGNKIVVFGLYNSSSRISLYTREGKFIKDIPLPAIGSIEGETGEPHRVSGDRNGNDFLFGYYSFFIPPTIYRYDLSSDALSLFETVRSDIDMSGFEVKQVWYSSKDGTKVSMFLTHKKGLVLDGHNPTILYGYGGFNVNETPYYSRTNALWFERGGVYALPQIRGGGEYGEEWHRGAVREKKQNSFDDFIAAAEWLIANKYTSREKLVIDGGSNGGLLTGAVLVQRPDLMKAVISSRPLLDMLRYDKFLIGALWVPEYGTADNPEDFKFLYAYSPYHHIVKGTAYPAVFLESADSESRVDPNHARKMAAALQAATSSKNPILLRVERGTGHGQGEPIRKVIAELLDKWCFIFQQLGM